ncbi:ACT domain-containing protein ACR1-like [Primulina tabacum]|uniref:ACT domain-containing protein ACR1-like n=1 Tax=Primulina tabacum TaxID=48773 RepID=UPI003F599727
MDITYKPYIDPEFESLIERINPPRVCIDNDTFPDCTLVKVDSANKQGMLLDMVQVLTDLDLIISKSYISSDGGWLMDVFHVIDQQGNKVTEQSLLCYIQEGICTSTRASKGVKQNTGLEEASQEALTGRMVLEMTGIDRPGLISEMSAVLAGLGCHISNAVAWTHNRRVACIINVDDGSDHGPITDPCRVAHVQAQLENVVGAHHYKDEPRSLRLCPPAASQTHRERRLHQIMAAEGDYEESCSCCGGTNDDIYGYEKWREGQSKRCNRTHVQIENCRKMGYSLVSVRSKDRPKLLFDTLCALMDLQYVVSHAAISSEGSFAIQEYYLRHKNGGTLDSESEKRMVIRCLIAATERRASHGLRLEIRTKNRTGLLSDVSRIFRENGLSITRAEIGIRGEKAIGTFYVKDVYDDDVSPRTLEIVRREVGGTIIVGNNSPSGASPGASFSGMRGSSSSNSGIEECPRLSFGSLLWAQLERLSNNFRPIKS